MKSSIYSLLNAVVSCLIGFRFCRHPRTGGTAHPIGSFTDDLREAKTLDHRRNQQSLVFDPLLRTPPPLPRPSTVRPSFVLICAIQE